MAYSNFSVEWLSKSCYNTTTQDCEEDVVMQTSQSKTASSLQPKVHDSGMFLQTEIEEPARNRLTPTSPNNSCGYTTSGSESEIGEDSEEGELSAQNRRLRTKFTTEQISKLENTFCKHKYLGATQRRKISEKLNLSETQIKTWFQNRRMKLKREVQDLRPEFFHHAQSSLLPPFLQFAAAAAAAAPPASLFPSFQHHPLTGQLPPPAASYSHHHNSGGSSVFCPPPPVQRPPFPTQHLTVQQQHLTPMMMMHPIPHYY